MAKYGMPYQGSKSSIADSIIQFLPKGQRFCDLFGGGFAMSECALKSGKYTQVLYNEINPLLPKVIKEAIEGKYNYKVFKPEWISREEFQRRKDKDGYVKYIWSFSNNGEAYMFSQQLEPMKKSLHNFVVFGLKDDFIKTYFDDIDRYITGADIRKRRMLLRRYMVMKKQKRPLIELQQLERLEQLERLQQLELTCGSYSDYQHKDGDVVYCDPPYEGAAEYSSGFDHRKFYDWVATRDYTVYFSSFKNISDKRFQMVWAKPKQNLMKGASGQFTNYECIYKNILA